MSLDKKRYNWAHVWTHETGGAAGLLRVMQDHWSDVWAEGAAAFESRYGLPGRAFDGGTGMGTGASIIQLYGDAEGTSEGAGVCGDGGCGAGAFSD